MESRSYIALSAPARPLATILPLGLPLGLLLALALAMTGCLDPHQDRLEEVMAGDCASCHINDWAAVEQPRHVGNFPELCSDCHLVTAWNPSFFTHDIAVGTCYGCHRTDYEASELPSHLLLAFPQTCDDCHRTDDWRPALDGLHPEERFPIAEGVHRPFECQSCHNLDRGSSIRGINADCTGCHTGAHARAVMDDAHEEVFDYVFEEDNPRFCLPCHPTGRE